jgi:predicted secreted protein
MAASIGEDGLVRATGTQTTDLAKLLGDADNSPAGRSDTYGASLNIQHPSLETTAFNASGVTTRTYTSGLGQWTGTFNGRWPGGGASVGLTASISTDGSAYVTGIQDFTVQINAQAYDITSFDDGATAWRSFKPGILDWTVSFNALIDDTTSMAMGAAEAESETFTIKLLESGADDATLSGEGLIESLAPSVRVGELNRVAYLIRGTGVLTANAGTGGEVWPFADGAVGLPEATEVVVTYDSGKTVTGTCFYTGLSLAVARGALIDSTCNVQGTGAVTIA